MKSFLSSLRQIDSPVSANKNRQSRRLKSIGIVLTTIAALLTAAPVVAVPFSTTTRPYRYQTNARGEIKFVSNTVATCSTLSISSTRTDVNGGSVVANDVITYSFTVKNEGSTTFNNLRLQSTIPSKTTYVPGSLKIDTVSQTDTAGNDRAEVSGTQINFRPGSGATSTAGGSLGAGATTTIEFQVRVNIGSTGSIVVPANVTYNEDTATNPVTIAASRTINVGNNTSTSTSPSGVNCDLARKGGVFQNNSFDLVYVDVDEDSSTFNSSKSNLSLPADAVVLFAGLYWGGSSTNTNRDTVQFKGPTGGYVPKTAAATDLYSGLASALGTNYANSYQGFKDVTAEVKAGGAGDYTVANIQTDSGVQNYWGGWSLVVVYGSGTERPRNLTVYDGYLAISGTGTEVINISGFITPPFGTVKAKIGAIAYDGDSGFTGDSATFQSSKATPGMTTTFGTATLLGDGVNPTNDVFNSTISYLGSNITTKTPNYLNQLGYDADIYAVNGIIRNGDNTATITLTTSNETYAPGVITSSIDLFIPVIDMGKSFVDLNGGNLEPGDILEYTIVVTNNKDANGNGDPANKNIVTDAIPANTTYVPGSLSIDGVAKTDASGDDTADFDGTSATKKTTFRIGANATATAGGTLAVNTGTPASPTATSTSTVKFKVKVNVNVADNTDITNVASSSYEGATLGEGKSIASASPGVTIKTDNPSVSGTLYKDNNLNSIFNPGEPLLPAGIKVTLYKDVNGDGNIDLNDLIVSEVDTDANGKYTFLDIPNGTYIIRVDTADPQIPAGKLLITPNNLTATVAGLPVIDRHFGFTPDPVASNLLLVKRITAINGLSTNPNDNTTSLTGVLVDSNWKAGYVVGATDGGPVKPGDTIEYTIYYLNNGGRNAKSARICDRLNANQTFQLNTYTTGAGMQVQIGGDRITNTAVNLTNQSGDDGGQFITATSPVTALPTDCKSITGAPNNDYGALILDLVTSPGSPNLTTLPGKTSQGAPNNSFGFWRFVTKVNKVGP